MCIYIHVYIHKNTHTYTCKTQGMIQHKDKLISRLQALVDSNNRSPEGGGRGGSRSPYSLAIEAVADGDAQVEQITSLGKICVTNFTYE